MGSITGFFGSIADTLHKNSSFIMAVLFFIAAIPAFAAAVYSGDLIKKKYRGSIRFVAVNVILVGILLFGCRAARAGASLHLLAAIALSGIILLFANTTPSRPKSAARMVREAQREEKRWQKGREEARRKEERKARMAEQEELERKAAERAEISRQFLAAARMMEKQGFPKEPGED